MQDKMNKWLMRKKKLKRQGKGSIKNKKDSIMGKEMGLNITNIKSNQEIIITEIKEGKDKIIIIKDNGKTENLKTEIIKERIGERMKKNK